LNFWKKYPLTGIINISIQNFNFKMYCDNDDTVVKELYWSNFNGWEKKEIDMIINLCKKKKYDYFFDIGSYSGFYSLLLSSIYSDINVYSFEIIDKIFERLNNNIHLNNYKNIMTINKGVADKNCTLFISKGSFDNGLSSVSYLTNKSSEQESINIDVVSIDSFLENRLNSKNILIKIDTEGTEKNVIKGMKYLMDNNNVDILIEVNDNNLNKFGKIFDNYEKVSFSRNFFL
jgi:FkbM family methyltransferase